MRVLEDARRPGAAAHCSVAALGSNIVGGIVQGEIGELGARTHEEDVGIGACGLVSMATSDAGNSASRSAFEPHAPSGKVSQQPADDGLGAGRTGPMPDILTLIEAEIPHLRRFARYLARDIDRGDDLVQECLTRAIAKNETWTPGTNLRAWLFTILKNCHINDLRRARRADEMPEEHPMLTVPANQDAHIGLLEVRDAYLRLSGEHREVLLLVAIEGLQYDEAAAVLDVPVGTVRSRLSRARQALRDALEEAGQVADRTDPLPSAVS
jgi:RNA polymerase sigma-70 factor, ECF subfamily